MDASRRVPKGAGSSRESTAASPRRPGKASRATPRNLMRPLVLALLLLAASTLVSLWVGYRMLDLSLLREDETARTLFFQLRLPRVVMAGILGASLGSVGACLQAFFRNPLAEPFTLGVSGGGTLGASVAIALVGASPWRGCRWFSWRLLPARPLPSWWFTGSLEPAT